MELTYISFPTEMRDSAAIESIVRKEGKSEDLDLTRAVLCPE